MLAVDVPTLLCAVTVTGVRPSTVLGSGVRRSVRVLLSAAMGVAGDLRVLDVYALILCVLILLVSIKTAE